MILLHVQLNGVHLVYDVDTKKEEHGSAQREPNWRDLLLRISDRGDQQLCLGSTQSTKTAPTTLYTELQSSRREDHRVAPLSGLPREPARPRFTFLSWVDMGLSWGLRVCLDGEPRSTRSGKEQLRQILKIFTSFLGNFFYVI